MKIKKIFESHLKQTSKDPGLVETLICLNNTIDEAREKICESIDAFITAKIAHDKVIEGVLKDIRASIDDAAK